MTDQITIIMPPVPPVSPVRMGTSDFAYVSCDNSKKMLAIAFKAISLTETWDFIRNHEGSFIMSLDNRVNIIYSKIEELGYSGHSGHSFCWTMHQMKYIAENGTDGYKKRYLEVNDIN